MAYHFEEDEALEYGDREAILIYNMRFWIKKNKANEKHFYDGRTWTYNKIEAFEKLFRFWTKDQVRRLIDSLVKQKVLMKGNYNANPHDRTSWYAFTDEAKFLREVPSTPDSTDLANLPNAIGENAKSNWQNDNMHLANNKNAIGENAKYTDKKPDKKPDKNPIEGVEIDEEVLKSFDSMTPAQLVMGLNDIARQRFKKAAPGWDIYELSKVYLEGIRNRARTPPKSIDAAFPGWCYSYTQGKTPEELTISKSK